MEKVLLSRPQVCASLGRWVPVRKTRNVTGTRSVYEKLVMRLDHSRVALNCSGKPKSFNFVVPCGKLHYTGRRVLAVPGSIKVCSAL
jgi:hypothetical protein